MIKPDLFSTYKDTPLNLFSYVLSRYIQHAFECDDRPMCGILVNTNHIDRTSGFKVLKTPTEMCQINTVHGRTHANRR